MLIELLLVSLFTTAVMVFALTVLSLPFVSFARSEGSEPFMVLLVSLLLILLMFVVSCIGLFAAFFIVLLKLGHKQGINLATDLLLAKWQEILATVFMFTIIYLALFVGGSTVLDLLFRLPVSFLENSTFVALVIRSMVLWGWLGVLNIFFYTAMFLLFTQLVKPTQVTEPISELAEASSIQTP